MFSDPHEYYRQFQETVTTVKQCLPDAHDQAIREYVLRRINASQWGCDHVMSVIQGQAKVGLFFYEEGEIKIPENYPTQWLDAPIVGFIEIGNAQHLTPQQRASLSHGLFVEFCSPWYVRYWSRFKRFVWGILKGFRH